MSILGAMYERVLIFLRLGRALMTGCHEGGAR